jgi:hypothetical protein
MTGDKIINLKTLVQRFVKGYNLSSIQDLIQYLLDKKIVKITIFESDLDQYEEFIEYLVDPYIEQHRADAYDYVRELFTPQVKFEDAVPDTSIFEMDREGVELIIGVYKDFSSFNNDLEKTFNIMK